MGDWQSCPSLPAVGSGRNWNLFHSMSHSMSQGPNSDSEAHTELHAAPRPTLRVRWNYSAAHTERRRDFRCSSEPEVRGFPAAHTERSLLQLRRALSPRPVHTELTPADRRRMLLPLHLRAVHPLALHNWTERSLQLRVEWHWLPCRTAFEPAAYRFRNSVAFGVTRSSESN